MILDSAPVFERLRAQLPSFLRLQASAPGNFGVVRLGDDSCLAYLYVLPHAQRLQLVQWRQERRHKEEYSLADTSWTQEVQRRLLAWYALRP